MTPAQYENWKDFALRMARHGFVTATTERREKIAASIEGFFSWYDGQDVSQIVDWDNSPSYICDAVMSHLNPHDHYKFNERTGQEIECGNKFYDQVCCCIRAGIDCASSPSAGVMGFTVGDLRRMYPEGIPDWAINDFQSPITTETPDDAGVWL